MRLFVEQLTVLDCAFLDARRGLVGESWIVDVELEGELDEQGMVLDFGEVKRRLKQALDAVADHKLLVPARSPALKTCRAGDGGNVMLHFAAATGALEHLSPAPALCLLDAETVNAEPLGRALRQALARAVPGNVRETQVRLRHEDIGGAYYHYAHGLKKHAGRCQRIAHGHRSRLEIRVDGRRDETFERRWAERWRDIYLGNSSDLVAHGQGRLRFGYASREGVFELELPAERCDLLAAESTVEHIAEHIAGRIKGERPASKIEVRAYEGVMKGAVARAG